MRQEKIWDVNAAQRYDTPGIGMFAPEVLGPTLVYLVYNTISNLLAQARQVACFRNAASHLTPGGRFVIELGVPELRKLPPGRQATVWRCEPGYIGLDTYDALQQQVVSHHFHFHFDDDGHAQLLRSLTATSGRPSST
ncbi:MAG TPA: hypothetical protein VNV66_21790 [Pilimelia sp.]|nr:hypothetical protein [Pilimelia sp.]